MSQRVFVCRCEDVTVGEIDHAIGLGLESVEELKRYTGLGTGPCQGKECIVALVRLLADRGTVRPGDAQPFTARPPAEPVTLATLAALTNADANANANADADADANANANADADADANADADADAHGDP
jgi:bacterioferritin-associated ferredoxin